MGRMQREKGKQGERELAALLRDLTGLDVQRRVRQHGGDSDLLGLGDWTVECKRAKAPHPDAWWRQAQGQGLWPVLIWRKDGVRQWWVRCWLSDILHTMTVIPHSDDKVPVDMKIEDWVVAVGLNKSTEGVDE